MAFCKVNPKNLDNNYFPKKKKKKGFSNQNMKHSLILLGCVAAARSQGCPNACDRMDSTKTACFVGGPVLLGQACSITRDCVNGQLSGDMLEPWWIRDDRHNTEKGLTCYNPTGGSGTGVCSQRFSHGQDCHTDDNCESRFCVKELYGKVRMTCAAYDSVPSGEPCPFNDPLGEDRVHSICKGKAHCYQADGTMRPGEGVAVCKDWDELEKECYILYNVDGVTIKGDSCDPYREDLVCIPNDSTARPPANAQSLDQLSIKGICREKNEAKVFESCAPYPGTNKRPYCAHDRFCDERITVTNGVVQDSSICSHFTKTDDPCEKDEQCKFGLGCSKENPTDTMGTCKRLLDGETGFRTTRDIFCAVGWERDNSNTCVVDRSGQQCTADSDCVQGTPDNTRLPSKMYCDTGASICRDVISHKCDNEFEEYVEYLFNFNKNFGRVLDRVQCTKDDYTTCFSVRGTLKKMRTLGTDLNCCAYRKANDDNTCFKTSEDIVFFPEGNFGYYWGADASGQQGDGVCADTGISAATIGIMVALFVFLFLMMSFILIKEYYWYVIDFFILL